MSVVGIRTKEGGHIPHLLVKGGFHIDIVLTANVTRNMLLVRIVNVVDLPGIVSSDDNVTSVGVRVITDKTADRGDLTVGGWDRDSYDVRWMIPFPGDIYGISHPIYNHHVTQVIAG